MSINSSALKRVLFVDDSPKFLQKLRAKMPVWSCDKWELIFAADSTEAFVALDTQQVDMVVIDLRVSGMDSLQFLNLVQQKHPHIRKAMLSAYMEERARKACLQSGADMYLIKPRRTNGFEAVFHSLNQLFTFSHEGFRGLLRTVSLTDLIQLECLNARSSVLEISAGNQIGQVFIKRGSIIHAQAGSKSGVNAFVRLMNMKGGDFNLKPFVDPGIQTIEISCDRLLLEASHTIDEDREEDRDDLSSNNNTTWFRKISEHANPGTPGESSNEDSSTEAAEFLKRTPRDATTWNTHSAAIISLNSSNTNSSDLASVIMLTDQLIADRSQLDIKILDMALLKEELNSCKLRLAQVTSQFQDHLEENQSESPSKPESTHADNLSTLILSLDEINTDTSAVVSQLDWFFASFTEESGKFNETSTNLQNQIARFTVVSVGEK